jgi:hypothetical protein
VGRIPSPRASLPCKINSMKYLLLLLLVLSFSACIKQNVGDKIDSPNSAQSAKSPEDVVRAFIDLSAASKASTDKAKLQVLCTGEMRRAFDRMTEEAFRIAYLNSNVRVKSINFLESSVDKDTAKVRYQVSVDNAQGTDPTQEINEREVDLLKTQGGWYIDSIRPKGSDKIAFTRGMIF